jgi:hypothetical protein
VVWLITTHHIQWGAEIPQENGHENSQLHPSKSWGAILDSLGEMLLEVVGFRMAPHVFGAI